MEAEGRESCWDQKKRRGEGVSSTRDVESVVGGDRTIVWGDWSTDQTVARHRIRAREGSDRQLDDSERAQRTRDAPWTNGRSRFDHAAVATYEDDVDWETHEKRMDGVGRRNDERAACR